MTLKQNDVKKLHGKPHLLNLGEMSIISGSYFHCCVRVCFDLNFIASQMRQEKQDLNLCNGTSIENKARGTATGQH